MNIVITEQDAFVWKDDTVKVAVMNLICSHTFQEMYSKVIFPMLKVSEILMC